MSAAGAALAGAAEALVGAPFRLHGRDVARGLDCVGLVTAALALTGRKVAAPTDYRLRGAAVEWLLAPAREAGFVETGGPIHPGDVLLVRPGPAQWHLLVAGADDGFIHAHAGLGRVVRTPAPLPWPVARHWRLQAE